MREDKINGRKKEYIIFREREREAGRERRMGGEREGSQSDLSKTKHTHFVMHHNGFFL